MKLKYRRSRSIYTFADRYFEERVLTEYKTHEPPMGVEIVYVRDNGIEEKSVIEKAGKFGMGLGGKAPRMRQQFKKPGVSEMFEVQRSREV